MTRYADPPPSFICPTPGARRRWKRHQKLSVISERAKPLPAVRQRPLTPPLPPLPARRASIFQFRKNRRTQPPERDCDQQQSPFFAKLPGEVRTLIYREVLAPKDQPKLHVASADARLLSRRCQHKGPPIPAWWHECWGRYRKEDGSMALRWSGGGYEPEEDSPYAIRMGLLQSCRRIYTESIDILYSDNVIAFRQTRAVSEFERTILPYRLHQVRFLHLAFPLELLWYDGRLRSTSSRYPLDVPFYWEEAWQTIPKFKSLQSLRVSLSKTRRRHDEPDIGGLVHLMKSMTSIQVPEYVVDFHWPVEVDKLVSMLGNEVPFEIRINEPVDY